MTKYLIRSGIRGMFKFSDSGDIDVIDYIRTNIDWVYVADEGGEITYKGQKITKTVPVKAGDIVIAFYEHPGIENPVVVIDNELWKQNIKNENEDEEGTDKKDEAELHS